MRLLRTWGLGACTAVALCVTAAVAVGQAPAAPVSYPECTKKPTPQDIEGAKGAHKAASQYYERAEYEKAIQYWKGAYEFDCTANDLLINIANAYERLGDRASTIITLETYLRRAASPNPMIQVKLTNLKAAQAAAAQSAAPSASSAPTVAPSTTAPPRSEGARPHGITPWIVVGGGGALAIVGAILLPVGYGNIAQAEKLCPDHTNCVDPKVASTGNAGRAEAGVGWALLTVGLAAAGGGVVWQMLFNKPLPPGQQKPRTGMWMTPMAGPGAAGLTFGGSF